MRDRGFEHLGLTVASAFFSPYEESIAFVVNIRYSLLISSWYLIS